MNNILKYIGLCIFIFICFYFISTNIFATYDDLAPGGFGRKNSVDTLENVFNILFNGGNYPDPDPEGAYPTQDPNVPTPSWPPGTTPTPTTPLPTRDPSNNVLNLNYNYQSYIANQVPPCLTNKNVYLEVESMTGVMWEVVAGIHFREGSCVPNQSCVSGQIIGKNEVDLRGNCTQADTGIGKPNPLPGGGCGFTNLLDSCVYGANHLIGKIGKIPQTREEFAKALGRYNGTGNANCGKTLFAHCPAPYEGYDHIHPMNKYDDEHKTMYLVYCDNGVRCKDPIVFPGLGALTVASIIHKL